MPTQADHTRDAKPRRPMRRGDPRLARYLNPPTPRERAALGEPVSPPAQARTYGYTRVSTDMQAEHGQSLELQRANSTAGPR